MRQLKFQELIRKNIINIPGWNTKRRIVVFESDDWGSIRMPSMDVYNLFLSYGIPVDKHYFAKNDCLESNDDLMMLFDVLSRSKDKNGNPPVITANAVVANPDFGRIAESDLQRYEYELITDTYKKYPKHEKVMELWRKHGIGDRMLWPQFHGREHINVRFWMKTIIEGAFSERLAFDNETILGMNVPGEPVQAYNYLAAFEYNSEDQMHEIENITTEGLRIFNELFGFKSKSFVPSCAVQGEHLDSILKNSGVGYHQCGQVLRPLGDGKYKVINKLWGQKNEAGQTYWRRNCTFEPSRKPDYDWADHCLAEMKIAFRWGKPAVINTHRVNYIGGIWPENRDNTLTQLSRLIKKIIRTWPDVEFITSDELGDLINQQ